MQKHRLRNDENYQTWNFPNLDLGDLVRVADMNINSSDQVVMRIWVT